MQIEKINQSLPQFRGALNNKTLLKSLEKISEHGTTFAAGTSLGMSLLIRPLAINSTPDVEKENKQYAIANSICSGLVKFALVESVALPIENAVKKIDKSPRKYLNAKTVKNLKSETGEIINSRSYKLGTQIMKLGAGFITAIPKSMLTIAFIPIVMDKIFNIHPFKSDKKRTETTNPKDKNLSFKGTTETLAKNIGKVIENRTYQKFIKKYQNQDKDIAKHISASTDILLTGSFAWQTNKSDKIKENRKKALIYNNVISTGITLVGGYGVDNLIKKHSSKFIEHFSNINKGDPKLHKYIEGLNIVRPAIIFAAIYYGLLPMFSTYMAEKIDKHINKES